MYEVGLQFQLYSNTRKNKLKKITQIALIRSSNTKRMKVGEIVYDERHEAHAIETESLSRCCLVCNFYFQNDHHYNVLLIPSSCRESHSICHSCWHMRLHRTAAPPFARCRFPHAGSMKFNTKWPSNDVVTYVRPTIKIHLLIKYI